MFRNPSFYFVIFVIGLSCIAIWTTSPPAVVDRNAPDSVFSATRAQGYLQQIIQAPHSTGTKENMRVRNYIISVCESLGLSTEVQHTTAIRSSDWRVVAAQVYNVIAVLKGIRNTKAVLVMAHYDSAPNAMGAGDDGAGVAAMLEVARILKSGKPLQNDVVFLFTDAEENGLLGAQAFVKEYPKLNEVGLVLNFEGRGNAGISTMFEANPENGWVVKEFIQAAKHPVANSLSYEVYKNLPNDTDYTIFKRAGITGLNHAFVDGYVNYHSKTDKAGNLDPRSLQHHGDNMLSLAKHFGNIDLTQTKAPDISYFQMMGIGMIHYPASWDKIISVVVVLLFMLFVAIGIRRKQVTLKGFVFGLFIFITLLVLLVFSSFYFLKGIKSVYLEYNNFYDANAYNAHYYFLALVALAVFIFTFLYQWAARKLTETSLLAGVAFTEILLMGAMYMKMPTATYVLSIPLLFLLGAGLVILFKNDTCEKQAKKIGILYLIFSIPTILLLVPTVYFMFIAFGLGQLAPGGVLMVGLILGLLLPLFIGLLKKYQYVLPLVSLSILLVSLVVAHRNSGYNEQQPFQTDIWYELDANSEKAKWFSSAKQPDFWNTQFFTNPESDTIKGQIRLVNAAPLLPLQPPLVSLEKDTTVADKRKLKLHCQSLRGATSFQVELRAENLLTTIIINGKEAMGKNISTINFIGLDSTGVDLEFEIKTGTPIEVAMTDSSIGIPIPEGYKPYASNVIPARWYNSNTTQVMKLYRF